jgi:hypothetical protein
MEEERIKSGGKISPLLVAVILLVLAVSAAIGYSLHQRNMADKLAAENVAANSALAQTQAQVQALTDKVNALTTPPPAPAQIVPANPAPHAKHASGHQRRAEDARLKKMQSQLDAQDKEIASTRQDLTNALDSAKTELNGSIARTHDELVLLQKRGERNYYEFDLTKTKQFQRTGPVEVKLRKANIKHQFADLDLMVNDANLTQKHVNLYQPVTFYAEENGRPLELVINAVNKNHIHGYVSTPKYKQSELAASPSGDSTTTTATQRQRLELSH